MGLGYKQIIPKIKYKQIRPPFSYLAIFDRPLLYGIKEQVFKTIR